MAGGGKDRGIVASSSSGKQPAARGIRILDDLVEEPRRRLSGFSLGLEVDGVGGGWEEDGEVPPSPVARARRCDVYVGYGGSGAVGRMVEWLRAELEMLGVPCVAADRRRCRDAPAFAAARAAMDAAAAGVVVVTPASLANPYAVEEVREFLDRGRLLPVFAGLGRADCDVEDVVEKNGDLWDRLGGKLWMSYDGEELEWRAAVDGLSRAEPAVEVFAGNLRDRVLDVLEILGARLGRRTMADAVKTWRAEADLELPLSRNSGFVGREKELLDLEAVLLAGDEQPAGRREMPLVEASGEGPFVNGAACISGESGGGKTELALEFAHRHAQEYKKVLWVLGEGRYLRQSYLKLADRLGVAVGDDMAAPSGERRSKRQWSFVDIEGDAVAKIRKELTRDIPYLLVVDNLESERDWWNGRVVQELLPGAGSRTHVIVTTRLGRLKGVRTFTLPSLAAPETMQLMKRGQAFGAADTAVLRGVEQRLRGVPLGLALAGAILSELAVSPAELRDAMDDAPYRAPTWEAKEESALRDNPGLVQLLDACFALLNRESAGLGAAAARLAEAGAFFAPAPIPVSMLVRAPHAGAGGKPLWRRIVRSLSCASPPPASVAGSRAEPDELAALLRLGIARRCTREGFVSVHGVVTTFSRKVGSGEVARSVVRTVAADGTAEEHRDHMWAACLSLFRFQSPSPASAAVKLPPLELARFVAGVVLPLAAHGVAAYSSYCAALELLQEATDAVHAVEGLYVAGSSSVELDPQVYQELAQARADVLTMRAKLMIRGGEHAIAENHCSAAISILEVVCGDAHPKTVAARAILDQAIGLQLENSVNLTSQLHLGF